MVNRIDWRSAKEPLELIHRAADELWAGRLVVLPTDTHYVAAALSTRADAVSRLVRAWGVGTAPEFVLAPTSPSDLPRFVKQPSTVARRLADRCWPGPVTLVFPAERAGPIFSEIHDSARKAVSDDFGFHLRLPHHKALEEILRLVPAPLVLGGVGGE
ncbi:MAG TPA: Sua5/YciO/YrdC/YwlC family protein, partial [Planctomycetia bacterium]|nr:Sua5/YciO/YrdC/YwlC family protein [Planctomycetia bacterium]